MNLFDLLALNVRVFIFCACLEESDKRIEFHALILLHKI